MVSGGEYDEKEAKGYRDAKEVAFRERVELHTTLGLVGDASGKKVIDVACGTGWLARELKHRANAAYVMGTDLSPEMIALAKDEINGENMDFAVEDIMQAQPVEFDIVTANWLLVNAQTRKQLGLMCQGLAAKAKAGGKLVTIILNPDLYNRVDPIFLKPYGFEFVYPKVVEEGATIRIKCFTPNGEFAVEIENYYFEKEVYIEELRASGFRDICLHEPKLSPHPSGIDDSEYWRNTLECPLFIAITAIKE